MATRLQPARPFGATGVTVPLIGYGTAPLGKKPASQAEFAATCNRLLQRVAQIPIS